MDLVEKEWDGVAEDKDKWRALVNVVMNMKNGTRGNEPSGSMKCREPIEYLHKR
jgi:hypothetical protein